MTRVSRDLVRLARVLARENFAPRHYSEISRGSDLDHFDDSYVEYAFSVFLPNGGVFHGAYFREDPALVLETDNPDSYHYESIEHGWPFQVNTPWAHLAIDLLSLVPEVAD